MKRNADMTVNAQETWLVTGAASGIGAAVVRAVRQARHQVLALDVNDVAGQLLASETGAIYRHCNVADPADWEALGQFLTSSDNLIGIPDRVHLNAGVQIAGAQAPLSEFKFGAMTLERYRRLMGVNVDGVVLACRHCFRYLKVGRSLSSPRHSRGSPLTESTRCMR